MSRMTLLLAVAVAAANPPAGVPLVGPVDTTAAKAPAGPAPVVVLAAWDDRRAEAWARGSPRLLARLYTPDSVAGRDDRTMLRAWMRRGLSVHGLRTQLLSVDELAHTRSTWTLRVTDRLVGGVAVGSGVRLPLPADNASTRTVRLRLVDGQWRVAEVRP